MLTSEPIRELIERHIDDKPERLAFALRNPLVTQQIKLLQKSRKKHPSYYEARCLLTQTAYEQSSSEATALARLSSFPDGGKLAVDLTCGLGVDSWAIARKFDRVIAVEADPVRAEMACWNFSRLGVEHVEVTEGTAERFMRKYDGERIDLIYLDPSRQTSAGDRVYSLEDSSPDVLRLLPLLRTKAARIMVKLSPMFDVEEVYRIFGEGTAVEVVSLDGECKEVLVKIGFETEPEMRITVVRESVGRYGFSKAELCGDQMPQGNLTADMAFIAEPDVAFYKARAVGAYARRCFPDGILNGYLFLDHRPEDFEGKVFRIADRLPYRPKEIVKILKSQGVRRMDIHRKEFPYSTEEIARAFRVAIGGVRQVFCTLVGGEPTVFFVDEKS